MKECCPHKIHPSEILSFNTDELRELNRKIVAELKKRNRQETREKVANFKVGQKVKFKDRKGLAHMGVVKKINIKTVSVDEGGFQGWKVHPNFLTAV